MKYLNALPYALLASFLAYGIASAQPAASEAPKVNPDVVRLGSTTCEVLYNKKASKMALVCDVPDNLEDAVPQDN